MTLERQDEASGPGAAAASAQRRQEAIDLLRSSERGYVLLVEDKEGSVDARVQVANGAWEVLQGAALIMVDDLEEQFGG